MGFARESQKDNLSFSLLIPMFIRIGGLHPIHPTGVHSSENRGNSRWGTVICTHEPAVAPSAVVARPRVGPWNRQPQSPTYGAVSSSGPLNVAAGISRSWRSRARLAPASWPRWRKRTLFQQRLLALHQGVE